MNYTWRILKLGLQDELNNDGVLLENAVCSVQWKRIAEDTDGTKASYVGKTSLSAANTAAADFIALNDLSNETVLGWITSLMSDAELARINSQLETKVERNRVRNIKPSW